MIDIRKTIFSKVSSLLSENVSKDIITVYHGTQEKFVEGIKNGGLKNSEQNYSQGWYVVSTDNESALYHAYAEKGEDVFVFEFEIPIVENHFWQGHPYLWKGEERNSNSTWFAQMQVIPKEFIKKLHKIPYEEWLSQKNKGF